MPDRTPTEYYDGLTGKQHADQAVPAAIYDPAPHKIDLELFEESTRGDIAAMRTSASADAIVDRIMSNPHLGDILAAARDRDRAGVQARRIQRDAAEVLRHRSEAIDALTADRDRLADELETETYRADCASENNNGLRAERDRLAAELARFKPQPMSQVCRDGDHNQDCFGCDCLCHRRQGSVRQWKVVAEGSAQALTDLLALPGVRESQLRAGVAEITRIQQAAIDALNGDTS